MLANIPMKNQGGTCFSRPLIALGVLVCGFVLLPGTGSRSSASQPLDAENGNPYRVLAPLQSGDLAIFPVVQANGEAKAQHWQYITLDEGLRTGQVVVAEAGQVVGLVRSRHPVLAAPPATGDEVNRLVLVNNSSRPLLLLAGEIVAGGKQDRVIGKDRIVPPESDPIDLSVFCIEPGRWTGESPEFHAAGKVGESFMVQPEVRSKAMAAQNQQQVWNAVGSVIQEMAAAGGAMSSPTPAPTTSYARAMESTAVENDVNKTAAPLLQSGEALRAQLSKEHAVGVVVAIRGEIIWADVFSDTDMLEKYWTKLIRSYAAEALTGRESRNGSPTTEDAERFLAIANSGHVSSEGDTGIYRYSTIRSGDVESFVLRALLPDTSFDVHISKIRTEQTADRLRPVR